jgi:hypothetical protein
VHGYYQCERDSAQASKASLLKAYFVLMCALGAVSAHGDDLTTTAGKTFHDIQVLSRNSSSLLIQSREGEYQLSLGELKPGDREKFSKDLTKAIELPALTVIGEEKGDFINPNLQFRSETLAQKEMQRQADEKQEAHKKHIESYQPVKIFNGVTFSLGLTDPKNDTAMLPDYVNPDYGRQSPNIVEKDLKIFSTSLKNPSP